MDLDSFIEIKSDEDIGNYDHNFRVVAGPGAGKTFWLVNHIKNVLRKSDKVTSLTKLICISYTNVAAEEIENNLKENSDRVEVSTIHSFLYNYIVKHYIYLITDEEGKPLVNFTEMNGHREHRPVMNKEISEWVGKINKYDYLKDTKGLAECLAKITWKFNENDELNLCYRENYDRLNALQYQEDGPKYAVTNDPQYLFEYKKCYWKRGIIHHDDVLYFAYRILEEYPVLLSFITSRCPYIFLDEFQDTNPIQTSIIKKFAEEGTIIGVVGDPVQSIYSFQGANRKDFIEFKLDNQKDYLITGNRRSTKKIVNFLNKIRDDELKQTCINGSSDYDIYLYIGEIKNAIEKAKNKVDNLLEQKEKILYILARKNKIVNQIKSDSYTEENPWLKMKGLKPARYRFYYNLILGGEYGVRGRFGDGLKEVLRNFKPRGNKLRRPLKGEVLNKVERRSLALDLLVLLKKERKTIWEKSIMEISNNNVMNILKKYSLSIPKITRGTPQEICENIIYKELANGIKLRKDTGIIRSIHSAKGENLSSVLICFPEEEDLKDYLIEPHLESDEDEARIYYVAMSRAENIIFFSVPELSPENRNIIEKKYEINVMEC